MSEREQNRRRESRPDKAPATVAVQDTEQESTIYQFLKKSREDSAEEKFISTKLDMSSNQVADQHRDAAQQSHRPSFKKVPAESPTFQNILSFAHNSNRDQWNDAGQQMLHQRICERTFLEQESGQGTVTRHDTFTDMYQRDACQDIKQCESSQDNN